MKKEGDEEQKESRMETQGLGVANFPPRPGVGGYLEPLSLVATLLKNDCSWFWNPKNMLPPPGGWRQESPHPLSSSSCCEQPPATATPLVAEARGFSLF